LNSQVGKSRDEQKGRKAGGNSMVGGGTSTNPGEGSIHLDVHRKSIRAVMGQLRKVGKKSKRR